MDHAWIWIGAYALTGLSYATRDAKEPEWNRPRALQTVAGIVAMVLGWPAFAMMYSGARALSHLILMLIFGGIGEAAVNLL